MEPSIPFGPLFRSTSCLTSQRMNYKTCGPYEYCIFGIFHLSLFPSVKYKLPFVASGIPLQKKTEAVCTCVSAKLKTVPEVSVKIPTGSATL